MTKEEAIGQLKFMLEQMPKEPPLECDYIEEWLDTNKDIRNALDMAIKTLGCEPCEDVISRETASDAIFNIGMCTCSTKEVEVASECLRAVEALPLVTPLYDNSGWIPVSEKPKEAGSYMTTLDYGEYGLSAGQRYYHGDDYGWSDVCVIAWMPLPEPYKPQESEGK